MGALEGAILGFLQARWDGAVYGAFFGLPIGSFTALVRWRITKDIRGFDLALFLWLLVEVIGILLIAWFVHLPFFLTMVRAVSGMWFLITLLSSIAMTVPVIWLAGWLFLTELQANLRCSTLAAIFGTILTTAAYVIFVVCASLDGVISGFLVPLSLLESPVFGVVFGSVGGVCLVGAVVRLTGALMRIARHFRRGELDSTSSDWGNVRSTASSDNSAGAPVVRSGLPEGQEPLPAWIPERIQRMLWELWIQSHWWPIQRRR